MTDNQPKPCGRCSGSMVEPSLRFATADGWVEFCEVCVRSVCLKEYGAMKERGCPPVHCKLCGCMMRPILAFDFSGVPSFAAAFPGVDALDVICPECFDRLGPGIYKACEIINEQRKQNGSDR